MRHTHSHTAQRRSHHALREPAAGRCAKCAAVKRPHTLCQNCGTYNGREVIDVLKKLTKKERKAKEKALAQESEQKGDALDAAQLSKT
jgi:large subunit ribosomal protein L32